MSEWISVDERLPDLGQVVALRNDDVYMNASGAQGDGEEGVHWHGVGYLLEFGPKVLVSVRREARHDDGFSDALAAAAEKAPSRDQSWRGRMIHAK